MDTKSQELFDKIISMDQAMLTEDQIGFLMARRGYMNDEQRKRYADMIEEHENKPETAEEKPIADMSVKALNAKAKELNIKGAKDMEKDELVAAIEKATA